MSKFCFKRCSFRLVGGAFLLFVATSFAGSEKPNILFIAVDDLNNMTGFAGDMNAITPNMDKLASGGVSFSEAYCAYPLCGPSRASLMSGMYFNDLNASKTQPKDEEVQQRVEAMGSSLLHTYLSDHGYKTMAVGKIFHRHVPSGSVDQSGGRGKWDFVHDEDGKRKRLNFHSKATITDWGVYPHPEEKMSDSRAAKWAVERLGEQQDDPFVLMVGFLRPHAPWYVPQKYFDVYDKEKLVLPPYRSDDFDDMPPIAKKFMNVGYPRTEWAIETDQWRDILHAYLASITFVDTKIGEVLDALEASPYKDNTIVILWGDHGYHMGEKNTFQKHTLWDRSGVTPLIIKAPGMAADSDCGRVVSLLDLYPTILDLCDLPPNEKVRGRSIKPLLEEPAMSWEYPAVTYLKKHKAIQLGDLRYIAYDDGSEELYNHATDPNEWTNLVSNVEYTDTLSELQQVSQELDDSATK